MGWPHGWLIVMPWLCLCLWLKRNSTHYTDVKFFDMCVVFVKFTCQQKWSWPHSSSLTRWVVGPWEVDTGTVRSALRTTLDWGQERRNQPNTSNLLRLFTLLRFPFTVPVLSSKLCYSSNKRNACWINCYPDCKSRRTKPKRNQPSIAFHIP